VKNRAYFHKAHFFDPHDIPGTTSKELHPHNRRIGAIDLIKQSPVEGAQSRHQGFHTKRVVNPLQPEYPLPSFVPVQPVEPKFLRDGFDVSDIKGTSPKKVVLEHPRETMKLDDIPGSQAGWVPRSKRGMKASPPRNILDVHDIVNVGFKSKRVT
jgi:hypothetical protein